MRLETAFTIRKLAALTFCGVIATTGAFAQDTIDHGRMLGGKMAMTIDSKVAMEAASGGMTEMALGKMARKKAAAKP